MTEAEWAECREPLDMLYFLRTTGRASDRKLRLLCCACCRMIWDLLVDERSRQAVEMAERQEHGGDGRTVDEEAQRCFRAAQEAYYTAYNADSSPGM